MHMEVSLHFSWYVCIYKHEHLGGSQWLCLLWVVLCSHVPNVSNSFVSAACSELKLGCVTEVKQ